MKIAFGIHLSGMLFGVGYFLVTLPLSAQTKDESTFSLSPGDVTEATIDTAGQTRLHLTLTPDKRAEFSEFTGRNLNKQVRIVVGGKLRSEPFIREHIAGTAMEVYVSSREDALATVKTLLTSTVAFDQLYTWTDGAGRTHYSDKPPPQAAERGLAAGSVAEDRISLRELQGTWTVIKATMNGKESSDPSLLEATWRFQGNQLLLQSPQKGKARFALKLDPSATPRAFQLIPVEPATEASGWMLFSREGPNLKIAFYDNLQGRPESFEPRGPHAKPELIVVTLSLKKY